MRPVKYLLETIFLFSLLFFTTAATTSPNSQNPTFTKEIEKTLLKRFSEQAVFGKYIDRAKAWPVVVHDETVGYVFETSSQVEIPAYSGKPVNLAVAISSDGTFKYAWVIEHHEPILLVGIPEQKLQDFAQQYVGNKVSDKIRVSASVSDNEIAVDAVTGATVTVIVVNETIMRASHEVAVALGIVKPKAEDSLPPSKVKLNVFSRASWNELTGNGTIRRLHLTRGNIDKAFVNTQASDVDVAAPQEKSDSFIDLYYTYLNPPTSGKNLLGESEYQWLMKMLKPGEHAVALMANGRYSFRGNGFVRGGIFDRIGITQKGDDISFRDLDYYRLLDIYPEGRPDFEEMAIYIIRDHFDFDPGLSWDLNLLVRRQVGPIESVFINFSGTYLTPENYIERPSAEEIEAARPLPLWVSIWYEKAFQLGVLISSLILLFSIIFLQNWLVTYPKFFHNIRRIYLVYTVAFIGWYGLGQLSVVNVLTFVQALFQDFRWELFLMDPMLFIIWTFTAATILLWGRGIFCGWLCPFGALQELINEAARKLKIKQFELRFSVHERLWALKYLILLLLFGVSLESMSSAERLAEVEPFKTSILLFFQREWWFVLYAVALLFVSIFTRKVYCRYICPLGAALAIPTKLRLFDWLKRRPECGQPCQLCAKECEIQAIHPDGSINANECHHCLDCQVTYTNENRCPPLVIAKKKGKKLKRKIGDKVGAQESIEIKEISESV
ncbi:transcriptional regulator NosR [Aliikangiella sp. G2MR2-5]|uniref:transcriptional regulator NosR n=1 Tax=Aliikangiella sp. G2MR2-5 TaxID=2788943 RepID=UPI0018ABD855|nr:NosR/NirI family protein [Aliikangiella sp. G2MR2-5]